MNYLSFIALIAVTYLTVFLTAWQSGTRNWLGVQLDFLPALMVYCGLSVDWGTLSVIAVLGGLWFDSLSANPLGISILPLFLIGFVIERNRGLILRDQTYAQFCLGAAASVSAPILTLLMLLSMGNKPLFGWGSIWQWVIMGALGGASAPFYFRLFARIETAFNFQRHPEPSFRPDREVKRGRV